MSSVLQGSATPAVSGHQMASMAGESSRNSIEISACCLPNPSSDDENRDRRVIISQPRGEAAARAENEEEGCNALSASRLDSRSRSQGSNRKPVTEQGASRPARPLAAPICGSEKWLLSQQAGPVAGINFVV